MFYLQSHSHLDHNYITITFTFEEEKIELVAGLRMFYLQSHVDEQEDGEMSISLLFS